MENGSELIIIGGGAAGLAAAIAAAREGVSVMIVEKNDRVGKTILSTGNGRCNLTNIAIISSSGPSAYNHPEFVRTILERYPCKEIRSFFEGCGLLSYDDGEGRVYPITNRANSVLDVLHAMCHELGIIQRCGFETVHMEGPHQSENGGASFSVVSREGERLVADAVVMASGGGRASFVQGLLRQVKTRPVLGPLCTDRASIKGLSGVRVRCATTLLDGAEIIQREKGELLFREYGVSGIMIFDLSRYAIPGFTLSIDFFPDYTLEALTALLYDRSHVLVMRKAEVFFDGMLHRLIARAVLRALHIRETDGVIALPIERMAAILKDFRLVIQGGSDVLQAQVTRGGFATDEFDPTTLAADKVEGLYAAGEAIDIDGRCGGYNLHWAWASGLTAGMHAARYALKYHGNLQKQEFARGTS